jgi:hypothetical protein
LSAARSWRASWNASVARTVDELPSWAIAGVPVSQECKMKKNDKTSRKSLNLLRQTVKVLQHQDLATAIGGVRNTLNSNDGTCHD